MRTLLSARTRGSRYTIYLIENSDGSFRVQECTHGKETAAAVRYDRIDARNEFFRRIENAKRFDGINYNVDSPTYF